MASRSLFWQHAGTDYPEAVRAEGSWIHTADGRRFLDGSGGALVAVIGHGVQPVIDAQKSQLDKLSYVHGGHFSTAPADELAQRLSAISPGSLNRVFLVSGGSEATESAIKLARQYHVERADVARRLVIGRWQGYHGNTLGALSASGYLGRRRLYEPMLLPFPHIPAANCYRCPYDLTYPDCGIACATALDETIRQAGPENVAAFIAEPVVGAAAAALVPPDEYFAIIREICDRYGVLFIADEVMTGVGRTGKTFAMEHWDVQADIMAVGKGISGGYAPLGATVATDKVHDAIADGSGIFNHGFTYDGHATSCAAGAAVLRYIEENDLVQASATKGERLMAALAPLREIPIVGDLRGLGMMIGVEFVRDQATKEPFPVRDAITHRITQAAFDRGLIIYPSTGMADGVRGDAVLIGPPLTIDDADLDLLVATVIDAVQAVAAEVSA